MEEQEEKAVARMVEIKHGMIQQQFHIDQDSLSIGRARENNICIKDAVVSGHHAEIFVEKNEKGEKIYFIQDLKSTNGLYLNKHKISCKQLKHKDKLRIGYSNFVFIEFEKKLKPVQN